MDVETADAFLAANTSISDGWFISSLPHIPSNFAQCHTIGPKNLPPNPTVRSLFQLFCNSAIMQHFIDFSNARLQAGGTNRAHLQQITENDLTNYFACCLQMRRHPRTRLRDYWKESSDQNADKYIPIIMSRHCWETVHACLGYDLAWLEEQTNNNCTTYMNLPEVVVVDESMVSCMIHHCPNRVFMPNKPIRNGLKVWVMGAEMKHTQYIAKFYKYKKKTKVCALKCFY